MQEGIWLSGSSEQNSRSGEEGKAPEQSVICLSAPRLNCSEEQGAGGRPRLGLPRRVQSLCAGSAHDECAPLGLLKNLLDRWRHLLDCNGLTLEWVWPNLCQLSRPVDTPGTLGPKRPGLEMQFFPPGRPRSRLWPFAGTQEEERSLPLWGRGRAGKEEVRVKNHDGVPRTGRKETSVCLRCFPRVASLAQTRGERHLNVSH